ncbi:MAG: hypothetical protein VX988_09890 [Planctomycetota bacterium]|nr:hypothetical protein [Planctomycetota bacterium]
MKQSFLLSLLLAFFMAPVALAEEDERPERPDRPGDGPPRRLIEELIERFDENGDGRLTGDERDQARRALSERRRRGGDRPPAGEGERPDRPPRPEAGEGDRPPRPEGEEGDRPRRGRPTREQILEEFDENGNGELDPPERERARAAARRRREGDDNRPPQREGEGNRPPRGEGGEGEGNRPPRGEGGEGRGPQLTPQQRAGLIRRFDRNGDGQLTGREAESANRFLRENAGGNRGGGEANRGGGDRGPGGARPGGDRPGGNRPPAPRPGGGRPGGGPPPRR